jgi:hypothetical protein
LAHRRVNVRAINADIRASLQDSHRLGRGEGGQFVTGEHAIDRATERREPRELEEGDGFRLETEKSFSRDDLADWVRLGCGN